MRHKDGTKIHDTTEETTEDLSNRGYTVKTIKPPETMTEQIRKADRRAKGGGGFFPLEPLGEAQQGQANGPLHWESHGQCLSSFMLFNVMFVLYSFYTLRWFLQGGGSLAGSRVRLREESLRCKTDL